MSDFSAMAMETFQLSQSMQGQFSYDEFHRSSAESEEKIFPDSPGFIYWLDKGIRTFSIRGMSVSNIREAMKSLESEDQVLLKSLRIKLEEFSEEIHFFETEYIELAEVIQEQLSNRRLPIQEDMLCNLSDPGFSWWLRVLPTQIDLYFRSYGIEREDHLVKLGPMGDKKMATMLFARSAELLAQKFGLRKCVITDKSMSFQTDLATTADFNGLKRFFTDGDYSMIEDKLSEESFPTTFKFYLRELAELRKFWIQIEALLEGNLES